MTLVDRPYHRRRIRQLLVENRVVALLGPRQSGKTTLARQITPPRGGGVTHFDLESTRDLSRLEDPLLALGSLGGLVVLDEVQRRPDIFATLRVLADRPRGPRFLVLGSASPQLLRQASESLAGRIAFHELGGFTLDEIGKSRATTLWLRGGFPRALLASTLAESQRWREGFISTFLERDLPQLGIRVAASTLRRFWSMLAHVHAQILNLSDLGRSMGVSDMTVRHYVDLLSDTFIVRTLAPWHENLSKRQVKSPKVYLRDSGLLHTLLAVGDQHHLEGHPGIGASWEGFCIETVIAHLAGRREQCFFWGTHGGAELDLLVIDGSRRRGFEIKRTSAPHVTASMRTALTDLRLSSLDVVHGGPDTFPLGERIRAVGLVNVPRDVPPLSH